MIREQEQLLEDYEFFYIQLGGGDHFQENKVKCLRTGFERAMKVIDFSIKND